MSKYLGKKLLLPAQYLSYGAYAYVNQVYVHNGTSYGRVTLIDQANRKRPHLHLWFDLSRTGETVLYATRFIDASRLQPVEPDWPLVNMWDVTLQERTSLSGETLRVYAKTANAAEVTARKTWADARKLPLKVCYERMRISGVKRAD